MVLLEHVPPGIASCQFFLRLIFYTGSGTRAIGSARFTYSQFLSMRFNSKSVINRHCSYTSPCLHVRVAPPNVTFSSRIAVLYHVTASRFMMHEKINFFMHVMDFSSIFSQLNWRTLNTIDDLDNLILLNFATIATLDIIVTSSQTKISKDDWAVFEKNEALYRVIHFNLNKYSEKKLIYKKCFK